MFKVGENVVYPMHGVGRIEKIEEKEVLEKKQLYYFVNLLQGGMTVMVPVEHSEKLRLRSIHPDETLEKVGEVLDDDCESTNLDWKVRYSNNQEKLKEGSVKSLAEVVRDLFHRNEIKELSRGEKKIYDSAFQLLCDELSYTEDMDQTEIKVAILKRLKEKSSVTAS